MPQLPSVSELLIGAHNPAGPGVRPESQLPQSYKSVTAAQKRLSETSPRQKEVFLPSGPVKPARVLQLIHAYPGMAHGHMDGHVATAHLAKESHVGPSAMSSGRNSVLSIGLDSHVPMDCFNYRESHRPRHVLVHLQLLHLQLHLLLLLPQLHYRPRQESSAGLVTRATLYQSFGSQESRLPLGESPTFAARPRPASFSYAPGPVPAGVPGPAYNPQMTQAFHVAGPATGPAPGAPGMVIPMAFYNGATAGSGEAANYGQPVPMVGYPGYYNTVPYNAQVSPGAAVAYEHYPHAQFKAGPPYLQMEGIPAGHSSAHYQKHGVSMEEMTSDPNHALINKRCIIKRRTRTGCLTCRKRRIKCDERKPHCFNCERLKKLCLGYEALNGKDSSNENTEKERLKGGLRSDPSSPTSPSGPLPSKERHRSSVHDLM
ncbi:hypothetical protein METBIDRAFT_12315 [Metschnikowia bicuspidata var. bicuspidata NRRL YB-4993]|uniref:Zn(2)-C6 fungal-type domain-containing protein n=1 Tax=Metschnikowia bicuspidata var. bicuspidata NRRL YB-4993 TaxID=869754 RepID=A0A1A0H8C0_9ASCO|nr:hypothetical protein METBIDRAFT_12315 [Metschnikowia bicuspidata var. bicuspidata NRRL YB-4993]OBA20271.1 hypothetical protein METBIDRAFT_12315 [Metschnikowia bicuspidata var. bicuspidata NRRL YB-4993]